MYNPWTHGHWQNYGQFTSEPARTAAQYHSHHYDWSRAMRHGYFRRGPSRLLWFAIGAVSATWWMKARGQHGEWEKMIEDRQEIWRRKMLELGRKSETTVSADGNSDHDQRMGTDTDPLQATEVTDASIDSALATLDTLKAVSLLNLYFGPIF